MKIVISGFKLELRGKSFKRSQCRFTFSLGDHIGPLNYVNS